MRGYIFTFGEQGAILSMQRLLGSVVCNRLARTLGRPWVTRAEDFQPNLTDTWHLHSCAIPEDRHTIAIFQLRRLAISEILPEVSASFASGHLPFDSPQIAYEKARETVEAKLSGWHERWFGSVNQPNRGYLLGF